MYAIVPMLQIWPERTNMSQIAYISSIRAERKVRTSSKNKIKIKAMKYLIHIIQSALEMEILTPV